MQFHNQMHTIRNIHSVYSYLIYLYLLWEESSGQGKSHPPTSRKFPDGKIDQYKMTENSIYI